MIEYLPQGLLASDLTPAGIEKLLGRYALTGGVPNSLNDPVRIVSIEGKIVKGTPLKHGVFNVFTKHWSYAEIEGFPDEFPLWYIRAICDTTEELHMLEELHSTFGPDDSWTKRRLNVIDSQRSTPQEPVRDGSPVR